MKLNGLSEKLRKPGAFLHSLMLLSGSSVAGQLIMLAGSPVLTRVYSPKDFGIAGLYLSVLGIVSVGAMLRYETAIAATKTSQDTAVVTVLAGSCGLLSALLAAALIPFAHSFVEPHLRSDIRLLEPYFYWIPVGIAFTSLYLASSMWAVRRQDYKTLSKTKLTQAIWSLLIQLGIPILHRGPVGLLAGQVAGQSGGVVTLSRQALTAGREDFRRIRLKDVRAAARRYFRFPILSLPAVLLDSLFLNAPLMVMTSLYGVVVAGWITLATRIFFLPGVLLSRSLSQVVLGEMSQIAAGDSSSLETVFWRRLKQLSIFGAAACLVAGLLAPVVIPFVYGKAWSNAAICAEMLLPSLLGSIVSSVFGTALDVLERQDLHLLREIGRSVLLGIAMGGIYYFRPSWKGALAIIAAMSAIAYVWYLGVSWWAIHKQSEKLKARLVDSFMESAS